MNRNKWGQPERTIRCAIYTRKSTEEGLDQEFNTLDAQRESGEAFVASQQHEGWTCLPDHYDDGGFTGGNMDRPGLKRLLADIEAKRVDCVVVYKVDRLSRSLMDFSRMMELFDRHGVSFVSVTQQFNTTHSMGRLTLNTRDWDVMYRDGFDGTLWKAGISIRAHLPQSPNLQAYVERLVQTIQQECLDHFVILGQRHFDHLISEFVEYSLKHRPHQALANLPLGMKGPPPEMATVDLDHIVRHETLGGLLKRYERREPKERPPTAGPLAPQAGRVVAVTP